MRFVFFSRHSRSGSRALGKGGWPNTTFLFKLALKQLVALADCSPKHFPGCLSQRLHPVNQTQSSACLAGGLEGTGSCATVTDAHCDFDAELQGIFCYLEPSSIATLTRSRRLGGRAWIMLSAPRFISSLVTLDIIMPTSLFSLSVISGMGMSNEAIR